MSENPALLAPPDLNAVREVVAELNSKRSFPWTAKLKELVALWEASGRNTYAMAKRNEALWQKIRDSFEVKWMATSSPRTHLMLTDTLPQDAERYARMLFAQLTLSPDCDKLAGPCPRCSKYFIRETERERIYCSSRCARQATAIEATIRARQQEHADKLSRAETSQRDWQKKFQKRWTTLNWKEYVCREHPDITQRFLTRAVNNGELKDPNQEEKK